MLRDKIWLAFWRHHLCQTNRNASVWSDLLSDLQECAITWNDDIRNCWGAARIGSVKYVTHFIATLLQTGSSLESRTPVIQKIRQSIRYVRRWFFRHNWMTRSFGAVFHVGICNSAACLRSLIGAVVASLTSPFIRMSVESLFYINNMAARSDSSFDAIRMQCIVGLQFLQFDRRSAGFRVCFFTCAAWTDAFRMFTWRMHVRKCPKSSQRNME